MKILKRTVLVLILLPILVAGIFLLVRYISYANDDNPNKTFLTPHLDMAVFNVTNMDETNTEITASLLINNPLPIGITADSIRYEIFISEESVVKSSYRKSAKIRASDTSWITVPVTMNTEKLINMLEAYEAQGVDSIDYEVRASFYTDFIFQRQVDVNVKKRLPLVHIPEAEVTRIEIDIEKGAEVQLYIHTMITNKNVFELKSENITYKFSVSGHPWVVGTQPVSINIPPQSSQEVVFPVKVQLKEVGATAFSLLTKGTKIDYDFVMNVTLGYEKKMMHNSLLVIKSKGLAKELIEVVKKDKADDREQEKEKKKRERKKKRDNA